MARISAVVMEITHHCVVAADSPSVLVRNSALSHKKISLEVGVEHLDKPETSAVSGMN